MYSSAKTSINKTKTPAVFKKVQWAKGTKNIDWGGGKYDTATAYLSQQGVSNWIYDPYNRTPWENRTALLQGPFDTATCSNVLNVIYNIEDRLVALKGIRDNLKVHGVAYITVYEGDKSGQVKVNVKKDSCQLNRRLKDYLPEVQKVFENDTINLKYGVITIIKEEE